MESHVSRRILAVKAEPHPAEDGKEMGSFDHQDLLPSNVVGLPNVSTIDFSPCSGNQMTTSRYLPTPVISSLDDREVKAVKIAAAITTALTWFLTHIPATVLPPPLQPAFLLLQKLAPYVGYIGTFVSWAWGGIKKCDNGNHHLPLFFVYSVVDQILRVIHRLWGRFDCYLAPSRCAHP